MSEKRRKFSTAADAEKYLKENCRTEVELADKLVTIKASVGLTALSAIDYLRNSCKFNVTYK